jgi:hypothetical protein
MGIYIHDAVPYKNGKSLARLRPILLIECLADDLAITNDEALQRIGAADSHEGSLRMASYLVRMLPLIYYNNSSPID